MNLVLVQWLQYVNRSEWAAALRAELGWVQ